MTELTNSISNKKLSLSASVSTFLSSMIFSSDEEKDDCIKYLNLKGISYHTVLANYIGFDKKNKIEYKKIAVLYKYDKRVRNILYKFLSALEENIRAFISNIYSNNLNQIKNKTILKNISNGSSLSKELENLEFSKLLNLSKTLYKKMSPELKKELYGNMNEENLDINLDAVRELRNAVSHHRILCVYEEFEECFVDNQKVDSLIHNIKNLYNLLNPYYQEFFKEQINNSCNDFKDLLPQKAILII